MTARIEKVVSSMATVSQRIYPLESGDRLSRAEFERRYMAMPDLKRAELIEGVVYVPSPVRAADTADPMPIS